jgi:hypothetical protein
MLLFYCVRSITGPTTEIFDIGFLLFAALICAGDQVARERAAARVARPSIGIHSQGGVYT